MMTHKYFFSIFGLLIIAKISGCGDGTAPTRERANEPGSNGLSVGTDDSVPDDGDRNVNAPLPVKGKDPDTGSDKRDEQEKQKNQSQKSASTCEKKSEDSCDQDAKCFKHFSKSGTYQGCATLMTKCSDIKNSDHCQDKGATKDNLNCAPIGPDASCVETVERCEMAKTESQCSGIYEAKTKRPCIFEKSKDSSEKKCYATVEKCTLIDGKDEERCLVPGISESAKNCKHSKPIFFGSAQCKEP